MSLRKPLPDWANSLAVRAKRNGHAAGKSIELLRINPSDSGALMQLAVSLGVMMDNIDQLLEGPLTVGGKTDGEKDSPGR